MRANIPVEVRMLLAEMAKILENQIAGECPACGAKSAHWEIPVVHENDCAIIRARYLLGKEVA